MRLKQSYNIRDILTKIGFLGIDSNICNLEIVEIADPFLCPSNGVTWTESLTELNRLISLGNRAIIFPRRLKLENKYSNGCICIPAKNPLRLFEAIIEAFLDKTNEQSAKIGKDSVIHNTVILSNSSIIGQGCKIGPYVIIGENVIIGNNTTIGPHSVIGGDPFIILRDNIEPRLRNRRVYGGVLIGNNVSIGAHCCIDRGIVSFSKIGDGSKIGNFVDIAHDVSIGNQCCICAQTAIAGYVNIESNCTLFGRSGISNKIIVAPDTTLLGNSILTKSITVPGKTLCGFPARDRTTYWREYVEHLK